MGEKLKTWSIFVDSELSQMLLCGEFTKPSNVRTLGLGTLDIQSRVFQSLLERTGKVDQC